MNDIVFAYWIYIAVLTGLSIWVARTIHHNSSAFLLEIFPEHASVASAVNNLLQTGFYLVAFGFGFFHLRIYNYGNEQFLLSQKEFIEVLAGKVGGLTLFIGTLLFFNLFLMLVLRKSASQNRLREEQTRIWMQKQQNPPVYPTTNR
jgi:nitrate reductase gamma subunit